MIYFTSDTHFGHWNINKLCNRGFLQLHEMNDHLIENWNNTIDKDDDVYHLGDIGWPKWPLGYLLEVLKKLNGKIHLVQGNHDGHEEKSFLFKGPFKEEIEKRFVWVKDYHQLIVPDEEMDVKQRIVLMHYPMESWNWKYHGSWHLHGHCHGNLPSPDDMARLDVGVDNHDLYPISYEQVKMHMTQKVFKPRRHK